MNSQLLTIIGLLSTILLLCTLIFYPDSNYLKLRAHREQSVISGRIISSYGGPIETKLEMIIKDKKYPFSSNKDGQFIIQVIDGKIGEKYTGQIQTTSLLLGYSYSNPLLTQTFILSEKLSLPDIILTESGAGSLVIKGVFNVKLPNVHLALTLQQENKKLQANSKTNQFGQFEFHIYGIKSLPVKGSITAIDNLQFYEPIQNLPITVEGLQTIIQLKPIEIEQSKSCRLIGCKTCSSDNQKCQECSYGFKLENSQLCKFGAFKGIGSVSVQLSNIGEIVKLVGTLVNIDFTPMINQFICLSDNESCAATGGTNHLGQFEMEVQSLKEGAQQYKFTVNNFSRDILISGDEQVQNLGIITIY